MDGTQTLADLISASTKPVVALAGQYAAAASGEAMVGSTNEVARGDIVSFNTGRYT